jgi:N utilization substance protein A
VVAELAGEKIDVIEWSEDPATFVAKALSPAQVVDVNIDEEHRIASVTVPERMLSLAIGREGQNARLAAKLTGWRIDIRSDTAASEPAREGAPGQAGAAGTAGAEDAAGVGETAAPEPAAAASAAAAVDADAAGVAAPAPGEEMTS